MVCSVFARRELGVNDLHPLLAQVLSRASQLPMSWIHGAEKLVDEADGNRKGSLFSMMLCVMYLLFLFKEMSNIKEAAIWQSQGLYPGAGSQESFGSCCSTCDL